MSVSGRYQATFEGATHALPQGMHMDSDYPFMLPSIIENDGKFLTIQGRFDETAKVKIIRRKGQEYAYIEQKSSYENIFRYPATKFKLLPFRDEDHVKKELPYDQSRKQKRG